MAVSADIAAEKKKTPDANAMTALQRDPKKLGRGGEEEAEGARSSICGARGGRARCARGAWGGGGALCGRRGASADGGAACVN
eukprot:7389104-Prymnesium_polylepis.1